MPRPDAEQLAAFVRGLRAAARERRLTRPKGPELAAVDDLTGPSGLRLRRYRPHMPWQAAGPAYDARPAAADPGGGLRAGPAAFADVAAARLAAADPGGGLRAGIAAGRPVAPTSGNTVPADGEVRRHGVPLLVYVHGGGFVFCDLDTHDRTCRRIAEACGVDVLAVDYRLAPEHPHPAGVDDVVEVIRWARPDGVAGDSAGGFLLTAACLVLRDAGGPLPGLQALVCPNTDLTLGLPSITEKGSGFGLDAEELAFYAAAYVPDPAARAAASPLHAADLRGLPPALVVTAEHDALRDEGDAYAARLRAAGVPVRHRREAGLPHGFIQGMDLTDPLAAAAHDRLFADFRELIRRQPS